MVFVIGFPKISMAIEVAFTIPIFFILSGIFICSGVVEAFNTKVDFYFAPSNTSTAFIKVGSRTTIQFGL